MKIISIIPARGGSKGIPRKNIINIGGKPLLAWSVESSLLANSVSGTFVSTDDDEIAEVANNYRAEVIRRPSEISDDTATTESAVLHALDFLQKNQKAQPDYVVLLAPTSPLRKKDDIDRAVDKIIADNADSLFSGSKLEDFLLWEISEEGPKSINYNYKNRGRRQDRAPQFVENGSIYIFKPEIIRTYNNRIGGKISLYEMEFWQTWEIDCPDDIELNEFYMNLKLKNLKEHYK